MCCRRRTCRPSPEPDSTAISAPSARAASRPRSRTRSRRPRSAASTSPSSPIRCTICATWIASSSWSAASGKIASTPPSRPNIPRIVGMASTVPYGGDAFLREFERAVKEDGLKGAWITSSLQGQLSGRRRRHAVLPAGLRARRAGGDPSAFGRLRRGADAGLPAGLQRRASDGQCAGAGAADRARHLREASRPSSWSAPIWAAASAR